MTRINYLLLAFAMGSMGAEQTCGNTQILRDPGFDLWCGDHLCAWKVERGDIQRVPTWNEADPGVQLIGNDAAIEQLSPTDDLGFGNTCIEFKMIANIDLDAHVQLNVDLDGDGTNEQVIQLPTAAWQPLRFLIFAAPPYAGIRFELAKQGGGTAILADIEANTTGDCGTLAPISARPFPLGSPCEQSTDCASGICAFSDFDIPFDTFGGTMVCQGCDDTSCTGGDVCGAGDPVGPVRAVPDKCVAPASKQLGDACQTDAECATGVCNDNACSTCGPSQECATEVCGTAWSGPHATSVCSPHAHKRLTGEPCAADDDCESTSCSGTPAKRCADGRACANDIDCPFIDDPASANSKINGSCIPVGGIDGGTCT